MSKHTLKVTRQVLSLGIMSLITSCGSGYIQKVISDKPLQLSSEWQELPINPALRCERTDQEVLLNFSMPYEKSTNPWGIRLQNGSLARPEAELVSVDGMVYPLAEFSFWGDDLVLRSQKLPNATNYIKLHLRSNIPVMISRVRFNCYNYQDVKR